MHQSELAVSTQFPTIKQEALERIDELNQIIERSVIERTNLRLKVAKIERIERQARQSSVNHGQS
jgi:hypothetical protein